MLTPIAQTLSLPVYAPAWGAPVRNTSAAVGRTLLPVNNQVRSWGRWATQLGFSMASLGISPLLNGTYGFFAGENWPEGGSVVVAPARGWPAPVPPGGQFGGGIGSAVGSGAGFFFGAATLLALAALFLSRVICTLRMFGASRVPQPFVLLLERPG
jgi:hypothetical protein